MSDDVKAIVRAAADELTVWAKEGSIPPAHALRIADALRAALARVEQAPCVEPVPASHIPYRVAQTVGGTQWRAETISPRIGATGATRDEALAYLRGRLLATAAMVATGPTQPSCGYPDCTAHLPGGDGVAPHGANGMPHVRGGR